MTAIMTIGSLSLLHLKIYSIFGPTYSAWLATLINPGKYPVSLFFSFYHFLANYQLRGKNKICSSGSQTKYTYKSPGILVKPQILLDSSGLVRNAESQALSQKCEPESSFYQFWQGCESFLRHSFCTSRRRSP